jgi:hypothetical protein
MLPVFTQCWISTVIGGVFLLVIAFGLIFFFNVFLEPEAARSGASASDAGLAGTGIVSSCRSEDICCLLR